MCSGVVFHEQSFVNIGRPLQDEVIVIVRGKCLLSVKCFLNTFKTTQSHGSLWYFFHSLLKFNTDLLVVQDGTLVVVKAAWGWGWWWRAARQPRVIFSVNRFLDLVSVMIFRFMVEIVRKGILVIRALKIEMLMCHPNRLVAVVMVDGRRCVMIFMSMVVMNRNLIWSR